MFSVPIHIKGYNLRTESAESTSGYLWGKPAAQSHILKRLPNPELAFTDDTIVAERWMVSDDELYPSLVMVEHEKNILPLNELLKRHGEELLGAEHYDRFGPHLGCLMKHLDTNTDPSKGSLSVQVHPALGHPKRPPKPELWYGSGSVYIGWKEDMSPDTLKEACLQETLTSMMHTISLTPDTYVYVKGATIHAIRADSNLYEWSIAPTKTEIQLGNLKDATVSPYDRTDGKSPRPGKEDILGTIDVLNHGDGWHSSNVRDYLMHPTVQYKDHKGNECSLLFHTEHLLVYRFEIKSQYTWEFPKAMSFYVESGQVMIGDEEFYQGEEGFLPYGCRETRMCSTHENTSVFFWCRV